MLLLAVFGGSARVNVSIVALVALTVRPESAHWARGHVAEGWVEAVNGGAKSAQKVPRP